MYTGMQLGTMKANEDAIRQALANQLGTYVLGAETGYNNAVVGHGKSTIGRNVFTGNYPAFYKAIDGKTKADIDMMEAYSQYMPIITRNNYRGQVYSSAGAADAAWVDYKHAIPLAEAKNISGIKSYEASAVGSDFASLQTGAQIATFARDQLEAISSRVRVLQEMQSAYSQDDPRWKNLQADIDNLRGTATDLGKFLGADFMLDYNPVKVYAGAGTTSSGTTSGGTTSGGTGTRTVVDTATGRAIQVPTINLMGYTPPSLSDIATRMRSNTGNVMGVQNIGGVPNIPTAQRTSTAVHFLPNGYRVVTTAPVSPPTQSPSQSQLIKNLNERRGGFL